MATVNQQCLQTYCLQNWGSLKWGEKKKKEKKSWDVGNRREFLTYLIFQSCLLFWQRFRSSVKISRIHSVYLSRLWIAPGTKDVRKQFALPPSMRTSRIIQVFQAWSLCWVLDSFSESAENKVTVWLFKSRRMFMNHSRMLKNQTLLSRAFKREQSFYRF